MLGRQRMPGSGYWGESSHSDSSTRRGQQGRALPRVDRHGCPQTQGRTGIGLMLRKHQGKASSLSFVFFGVSLSRWQGTHHVVFSTADHWQPRDNDCRRAGRSNASRHSSDASRT
ncbi:hypothetical protein BN2476_1150039 [Paraburkholderia piptadeniae]|uniref:Uncharacterized protein n=1 Tax=Paraburkholderia piptadeniae TaxID=1701573 RepID=A0A1N7SVB2_9BURK|nr:hypothetical protein BN2476_1150039 [Paraburkholderia piptadeniae]